MGALPLSLKRFEGATPGCIAFSHRDKNGTVTYHSWSLNHEGARVYLRRGVLVVKGYDYNAPARYGCGLGDWRTLELARMFTRHSDIVVG